MKRRRFRPQPLTRRRKLILIAVVALPILAVFTFGNRGLLKRLQLEARDDRVSQELVEQQALSDSLKQQIEDMKTDSLAVERIAREEYGMAREGEKIYKVVEEE